MMVNASCTLYRWNQSTITYDRFFISHVYWRQTKTGKTLKTGDNNTDGTTVYLYKDAALPMNPDKDMMVRGYCPFVFNGGDEIALSAELKEFRRTYDFVVVYSFSDYMFGSLPHYEVYAE